MARFVLVAGWTVNVRWLKYITPSTAAGATAVIAGDEAGDIRVPVSYAEHLGLQPVLLAITEEHRTTTRIKRAPDERGPDPQAGHGDEPGPDAGPSSLAIRDAP